MDNRWVHNRCAHIHNKNKEQGKANLEKWAEKMFFCPKHMPAPTSLKWHGMKKRKMWFYNQKVPKSF